MGKACLEMGKRRPWAFRSGNRFWGKRQVPSTVSGCGSSSFPSLPGHQMLTPHKDVNRFTPSHDAGVPQTPRKPEAQGVSAQEVGWGGAV